MEPSSISYVLLFRNDETMIRKNFSFSDRNSLFVNFMNGIFAKGL